MGLQVRLRHALGERVLELPERAVDDPVVVGRAGDADVQVPSINVGQRHLVLFVHEGRWVAQNGPDSTGTALGGAAMPAAHVLGEGDVLTLGRGADAPTVQVEAINNVARPTAQAASYRSAVAPAPPAGGYAPPTYPPPSAAPVYAPPAYEPEPAAAPAATDDGTAWMTADAPARRFYTPKRRKSSDAAIVIGVVTTVAILAGAGVFIYLQKQKTPKVVTVVQTAPAPVVPTTTKPPPRSMFTEKPAVTKPTIKTPPPPPDVTDELRKPNVTIKRASTGGDESTTPEMPESTPSENVKAPPPVANTAMPPEAEKAFKRVESTYWETDPAKCLLAIDSFQAEFPGVETKKLEQYREDMLDKAWWLRVDSLFDKQSDLKKGIKKTEQDIKDETEAAYKTTVLMPRLEDQKARLAKVTERLAKEMNYKETVPPPIGEEGKLQAFRAKRDKTIYDAWKARILKYVRDNHGTYPWANEK